MLAVLAHASGRTAVPGTRRVRAMGFRRFSTRWRQCYWDIILLVTVSGIRRIHVEGFRRFSTRWQHKIHIAGRTWHTQGTSHDFAVSAHAGGTLRCEQGPRYYKKCRR